MTGRLIRQGPTTGGTFALTFDDGPHPDTTPALLRTLAHHDARATFFLIGSRAEEYPELVADIAEAGHAIGLHGWEHRSGWWRGPATLAGDLELAERAVGQALVPPKLFRPPFGYLGPGWWLAARRRGYRIVMWSLDAHDWQTDDSATVAERLMQGTRSGTIALLHECRPETGRGYEHTVAAVDEMLRHTTSNGLRCVTVRDWIVGDV